MIRVNPHPPLLDLNHNGHSSCRSGEKSLFYWNRLHSSGSQAWLRSPSPKELSALLVAIVLKQLRQMESNVPSSFARWAKPILCGAVFITNTPLDTSFAWTIKCVGAIIGLSLMRIRSSSEAGLNIGNFHGTNEFGSSPIFIHASLWPGDETAAI